MTRLRSLVETGLKQPAIPAILSAATTLQQQLRGDAVLFYGSSLRSGDLEGVLDFYVLHAGISEPAGQNASRVLWPDVSYHELDIDGQTVRAKVATMDLSIFERAASGKLLDTTIWTRFSQPSRLLLAGSPEVAARICAAIVDSIRTATQFALVLGPASGVAADYWTALFAQTYGAEFRIERQTRRHDILSKDPAYYDAALPLAWEELGYIPSADAAMLTPQMANPQRRAWKGRWRRRKLAGKALNVARLVKATRTFEGAPAYALWKIERHSGVHIAMTPWIEKHPVLAAPGVLLRLWRERRK